MSVIDLLKLEWSKWKHNSAFQILVGAYLILFPTTIFIGKSLNEIPPLPSPKLIFEFPAIWDYLGYSANWLQFFCLGYLAVYLVTAEYGWKTLRQSVLNGQTRLDYFKGKLIFGTFLVVSATVYYIIVSLLIGFAHTDEVDLTILWETEMPILRFFVMGMSYLSFGYLVGTLFKRSGLAIFIYFAYVIFLEPLIRWTFHYKVFGGNSNYYYPLNAIEDLMPNPLFKLAGNLQMGSDGQSTMYILSANESLIWSCGYLVVFLACAWLLIKRRDM